MLCYFSHIWLFATLRTVACQAPLSMEFSRQEYWSELPCPPPRDLPNPDIKPKFPALQGDSLLSEPLRKPKNTGVGSLSLLQGIFQTQKSNQGLLNYRQILYQLSYQESPLIYIPPLYFAALLLPRYAHLWASRWRSGKKSTNWCRKCKRWMFSPLVGKIPWGRKWQHSQYCCLENFVDRGAWQVTKSMGLQRVGHYWAIEHAHNAYL